MCFVVMPFASTRKPPIRRDQWEDIFRSTFKPAIEAAGYSCARSPDVPGNFVQGIVQSLETADLVLADLTGMRPNVFYELGVRHARRVGTIMVAQDLRQVPSDLRTYWTLQYGWTTESE